MRQDHQGRVSRSRASARRFLPATKASPKEMLPVVDKPLIQYAVEEAAAAGITDMIFITGRNKRAIEDHFDKAYELETELALRNKTALLEPVQAATPPGINCIYIRQTEALGLGHAVLCARAGGRRRAVRRAPRRRPDRRRGAGDAADGRRSRRARTASTIGVMNVAAPDDVGSYGIVETGPRRRTRVAPITRHRREAEAGTTPSTLAVVGRYVLTPRIFHHLRTMPPGAGGEIQLTDGIARLLAEERVLAYAFDGRRYDCGSKLGYLEATVDFGLKHPETGRGLRRASCATAADAAASR